LDKKTVIAVILIFIVFFLSNEYIWKNQKIRNTKKTQAINSLTEKTLENDISNKNVDFSNIIFNYERFEVNNYRGIRFYLEDENSRFLIKEFVFVDNFNLQMHITSQNYIDVENYTISLDCGIKDSEDFIKNKRQDYKLISQVDNSIEKLTMGKLKEKRTLNGNIDWAVLRSKYFYMGIIPDMALNADELTGYRNNESPAAILKINNTTPITDLDENFTLSFGPVIYKDLEKIGNGFENVAEMGASWLRPISKLFDMLLKWLHSLIPNYGVCIILFAFLIKLLLYPLSHKSFESSHRMQKVQPQLRELQTKYKKDPKQFQIESKKLYKEHGVNPLGGCLPMLLQMPVFFALYPVLRYSIDFRQANFMFWLSDLSAPDPYLVLPIMMGVFMFVQQKLMTPTAQNIEEMDEKQQATMQSQKMMAYIMPFMMFFLFKSFPAGLVLYWTLFNVFSIVQQYIIKKKFR